MFKVGDKVEYELSWWGGPAWLMNTSRSGSGMWEKAEVIEVRSQYVLVTQNLIGKKFEWPLENHPRYTPSQWGWDGYLRKVGIIESIIVKCQCGAETTYGKDCGIHSDWCPKHKL